MIGYGVQVLKLACIAALAGLIVTYLTSGRLAAIVGLTVFLLLLAFAVSGPVVGGRRSG
jgi:hypothetical protein